MEGRELDGVEVLDNEVYVREEGSEPEGDVAAAAPDVDKDA